MSFPLAHVAAHPPPPGLNYLAVVEPCYTFVLISLPLSAILVPILLLILFFSTPNSRRTLLFAVNVLIVLLGIVEGILSTIVQSLMILHPRKPMSNPLFVTYISFTLCTPIIVDCVLILRLRAVYPATITRRSTRFSILAAPILCSIARVACVSVFVREWALRGREIGVLLAGAIIWPQNLMIIADWSLQLFENFYCSILFLFRLRGHKAFSSRMYRNQTIVARLRALFYIAVSNFVFPTMFSVVQLIFIARDPSVVHGATILMVNNYVSIIGVVFSTLWCSSDIWRGTHNITPFAGPDTSAAFPQSIITLSGIAPNLHRGSSDSQLRQPYSGFARTHASGRSLSRGRRPHPLINRDVVTGNIVHVSSTSKEHDATRFLRPIALPRVAQPMAVDGSDIESSSCSPITLCDRVIDSECRGCEVASAPYSNDTSCAAAFTDTDLEVNAVRDLVTSTPLL